MVDKQQKIDDVSKERIKKLETEKEKLIKEIEILKTKSL